MLTDWIKSNLVAIFLLLISLCGSAQAAPTAPATEATGILKLEGNLDEPAWSAAPWQSNFLSASVASENAGQPKPIAVQTRFKVLYDPGALYVGVECDEPSIENLRAEVIDHDGTVYGDDCVEIFFDPAGEGRYYHHFIVNTKGAWYDDYGVDYGLVHNKLWACPLEVGTKVDAAAKVWRVEVKIPLAALQLKADAGPNWLWNVARERYASGAMELSTWSPLKGNFHSPKLFGRLTGINVDFKSFAFETAEPQVSVSGGGGSTQDLSIKASLTNQSGHARKLTATAALFNEPKTAVKSEPVDLAAGAKAEFAFPPLTVSRSLKSAQIQLSYADADSGAPYKIVIKELSSEYRPITVDILRPVYRQNIYATENVPQLVFKVRLAEDVAARAQKVVYRLLDEAGKAIREGSAIPADLTKDQKLQVGTAPVGTYTLSVQATDKAGAALAECKTTIRKLPPPPEGNEVRIDEHRNILVNGKPKVFIGWYGNVHTEDPRPDVVALQDIQTPVVINYPSVEGVEKPYAEHGIYSIVSVEPGRLFYSFNLWQKPGNTVASEITKLSEPSEECRGYVKQLIDKVSGQPGLIGYYLADEPEINNARSDYLESFYKMLQELDPYHPVIITNDTLDGIVTHGYKACDILSPDPYSDNYDYVSNFMKKVLEVATRGKATMITPWASSGQAHFTNDYGTAPPYPYKVIRNQYLAAIVFGARGFKGYTDSFFMPEPILRYGLPPIWREVRFLESAMGSPAPAEPLKVDADAEMANWIRQKDGKLYLIVVNHKPGARKVTINHSLLKGVSSIDVVSEGRQVAVKGGTFTDRFAEGDARIYTTDPAGRKLPTTGAVEKEIAKQEAACVKPGNSLHWSRGVRARASEGYYAPWFNQYYYYAINGITDDLGWYLSHTDKPAWLELSLPKEAKIGRVVIYSPNLRDYDLRFTAADGTTRVAEVRGNTDTVVKHYFDPLIPALKLRITAIAARQGTEFERPVVREIEAYGDLGKTAPENPPTEVEVVQSAVKVPDFVAPAQETSGQSVLWAEDFKDFRSAEKYNWDGKDDKWVFNPKDYNTEPKPGGGLTGRSLSPVGYSAMSHIYSYDSAYRYFQVKISSIEGEGYRFGTVVFGDSSGKPGYRSGVVNSNKPGIYTADTWFVHDSYQNGTAKNCFIALYGSGSEKQADGTVKPGVRFTYDWLRLVRRPQDGLIVTMADGSPLKPELQQGDELLFRVCLEKPAVDAVVESMADASYFPLPINGEPYVQLVQAGNKDGREWAAQVKLGQGTGKYDGKGYPVFFRAKITGGAIAETLAEAGVSFR